MAGLRRMIDGHQRADETHVLDHVEQARSRAQRDVPDIDVLILHTVRAEVGHVVVDGHERSVTQFSGLKIDVLRDADLLGAVVKTDDHEFDVRVQFIDAVGDGFEVGAEIDLRLQHGLRQFRQRLRGAEGTVHQLKDSGHHVGGVLRALRNASDRVHDGAERSVLAIQHADRLEPDGHQDIVGTDAERDDVGVSRCLLERGAVLDPAVDVDTVGLAEELEQSRRQVVAVVVVVEQDAEFVGTVADPGEMVDGVSRDHVLDQRGVGPLDPAEVPSVPVGILCCLIGIEGAG